MSGSRVRWSRSGAVAAIVAGAVLLAGGVLTHPVARAVVAPPAAYVPVYHLTDLGHASGDTDSFANGINATGDVTGWTSGGINGQRAFRYSGTTMTALDHLGSLADVGFAINASGEVAGGEGDFQSFTSLSALTWTGTSPVNIASGQTAIAEGESVGQVVGLLEPTPTTAEAFLYDTGSIIDLNTVVHSGDTTLDMEEATGINDDSQIVGDGAVGAGPLRGFFFDSTTGALTNLGVLGGKTTDDTVATGLNASGDVVGYQFGALNHAFMWDGGSLHDLGTLSGYPTVQASAINASDWIVGFAAKGSGSSTVHHAVVWAGGAPVDLNSRVSLPAGWDLQYATGINDAGQIVGGALVNGHEHAFRLTPSNVSRTFGADRYTTAAQISAQNYTSPQATVYIANGQNFPDALGGAALAGRDGAPLLLVPATGPLPAPVLAELQRLAPTSIVIFGGTGAVSAAMIANIVAATGVTPTRTFGATRYDTAAAIASTNYTNPQPLVYVANGQNFPDALAGAALAASKGAPLLLVPTSGALPTSVANELNALHPDSIVIFGGTGAVSTSMEELIAKY
jgi:probable HAF family extracellular repeat protein